MRINLIAFVLLLGCNSASFHYGVEIRDSQLSSDIAVSELLFDRVFKVFDHVYTAEVPKDNENETFIQFRLVDQSGKDVITDQLGDLIQVIENQVPVNNWLSDSQVEKSQKTADIIFLVDITGTMTRFIEMAKIRLLHFIRESQQKGFRTRMCVSTFGDYTVKYCNRFFLNDPQDPSSEAQVQALIQEITNLRAFQGPGQDPGWPDLDENPMRAIIDAAEAPWGINHSRFVILVTDWSFLYSPSNQGQVGRLAPYMWEVHEAIERSQMKIFAITPSHPGYNLPFRVREEKGWVTYPSIVDKSGGEHFLFQDLMEGRVSLSSIFDRILNQVRSTYQIRYSVNQIPQLNPHHPLSQRHIQIQPKKSELNVIIDHIQSTWPNGQPLAPREWIVSSYPVDQSSAQVFINGTFLTNNFQLLDRRLILGFPPQGGSQIMVVFRHRDPKQNFNLTPIHIDGSIEAHDTFVLVNGQRILPPPLRMVEVNGRHMVLDPQRLGFCATRAESTKF